MSGGADHAGFCTLAKAADGVDGADLQEASPDDFPRSFHHPLHSSALVQLENQTTNP